MYGTWDQVPTPPVAYTGDTIREFVGGRICETCGYDVGVALVPDQGLW